MRTWICFLIVVCFPFWNGAQTHAYISKSVIQLGQPVKITYELTLNKSEETPRFDPFSDAIPCQRIDLKAQDSTQKSINLEILGKFSAKVTAENPKRWIGTYTVTAWDTGVIQIPAMSIQYADSSWKFPTLNLAVSAPPAIAGQDLIETEIPFSDFPFDPLAWIQSNYGWLLLFIVAIAGLIFWRYRKSKKQVSDRIELTLSQKTLLAIESLEKAKLWEKEGMKSHYLELTFIIKSYLSARFGLNLLDKTTFQTTALLISAGLSNDIVDSVQHTLEAADMVKFAKSQPDVADVLRVNEWAKQLVVQTTETDSEDA